MIDEYKKQLQRSIEEYAEKEIAKHGYVTRQSAYAIDSMISAYLRLCEFCEKSEHEPRSNTLPLSTSEIVAWNAKMKNDDGTAGGHWNVAQTTAAAKENGIPFEQITKEEWNVAMNMMYSDYCTVVKKSGITPTNFYPELAKAFLFDKDGGNPKEKLAKYYRVIASQPV